MRSIAIVGRACVLPGALSPEALWQAVVEGRDLTTSGGRAARPGRPWVRATGALPGASGPSES
ncbi:MAG: hypothetical protein KAX84_21325, partial [Burkholderiales bacterium]|nr:hypothetical protein [Burkholderiales bacterium]